MARWQSEADFFATEAGIGPAVTLVRTALEAWFQNTGFADGRLPTVL
jgi:hypothetical protein